MLISLYIIYLKPFVYTEKKVKSVLVIDSHTDQDYVDSLISNSKYDVLIWDNDKQLLKLEKHKNPVPFTDLEYAIDTLFAGENVPPINPSHYQHRINLNQNRPRVRISFPETITLGEALKLEVHNISNDSLQLAGQLVYDSISQQYLSAGEKYIKIIQPKVAGPLKGHLIINQQEEYHFSVLVREQEKFVFHLLAESPDFEWRFLKDYLEDNGHAVYLKSRISKDKYKSSFSNWPDSLAQQKYSSSLLKAEILILDMEAWNRLNFRQKQAYTKILKSSEGSLVFRANPNSKISLKFIHPSLVKTIFTGGETFTLRGVNQLKINNINSFTEVNNLSLYKKILPRLSIGIISIQDSYKWQLGGLEKDYENYWVSILNTLVRREGEVEMFKTEWPVQYQPFHVQLWSDQMINKVEIVNSDYDTISFKLIKDIVYPERQHLVYYPDKIGWHSLFIDEKSIYFPFYVHKEAAAHQDLIVQAFNYNYYAYHKQLQIKGSDDLLKSKEVYLTLWFFLLFLLSSGFLWLEEKI